MNRLSQQLAIPMAHYGTNLKKKSRAIVMQIFGHEGLVDASDLCTTSHCPALNEDIYRLAPLRKEQLALRKLLNPFKWLEFLIVFPAEIVIHYVTPFDAYLINTTLNVATGIARRPLAPVRYIIRPTIELIQTSPKTAAIAIGISLAVMGFLAATIASSGATLALGIAMVCVWPTVLKLTTTLKDIIKLHKDAQEDPSAQQVNQVIAGSTAKMAETLHAMDPAHAEIKKPAAQTTAYKIALFTGTEALFYKKPKNQPIDTSKVDTILHFDLDGYERTYDKARTSAPKRMRC